MLPKLPNRDRIRKAITLKFSGINRNPAANDGTIRDTMNMGSDRMPLLSPRKERYRLGRYADCCGVFAYNGLYLVDSAKVIYRDGAAIGLAANTEKKIFAVMNDQIVMLPDKLLIETAPAIQEPDFAKRKYIRDLPVHFLRDPDTGYSIIELRDEEELAWRDLGINNGDEITVEGSNYEENNRAATVLYAGTRQLSFAADTFRPMENQTIQVTKDRSSGVVIQHVAADFLPEIYSETLGMDVCWLQAHDHNTQWGRMGIRAGDRVLIRGSSVPGNNRYATVLWAGRYDLAFPHGTFAEADDQILTIEKATQDIPQTIKPLEVNVSAEVIFRDGTIYGESAEANTIRRTDGAWTNTGLKVGDAVTIQGSDEAQNNGTFIIREIDGYDLRFYENSFVNTPSGTETVTVTRTVPDMDGILTNENRLWGWKGSTIYASKLGDPTNFNVYDGLENDSWTWEMDGSGDILGAIVYQGYPMFFKEDKVVRIYGDRPSQFRAMDVTAMGIHPGCGESLAIAGDTLYYISRNGMTAYNGGYSHDVHAPFGETRFTQGRASSDGRRYFLSAGDGAGWANYVYDSVWDCWFREDAGEIPAYAWDRGNLYMLYYNGDLWLDGHAVRVPETAQTERELNGHGLFSRVEFNDFTGNYWSVGNSGGNPSRKGTSKIQLRVTLEAGSKLDVIMVFDDDAENPVFVKTLEAEHKRSFYLPIIPRRSDHYRIILNGTGDWTLNSLVREEYSGSDIH